MSDPRCDEVRDLLAEAALGVLAEPERSEVLSHAESCAGCRRAFDELLHVSDSLVALVPEAEPPPGFEHRVLARLGARERRSRWSVAAAVVVVLAGIALGAWIASSDERAAAVDQAQLRTDDGEVVGNVLLAGETDRGIVLRLDRYREGAAYTCQVVLDDGRVVDVGTWRPTQDDGPGWWVAPLDTSRSVAGVRLLVGDGEVWADGEMP